MNAWYLLTVPLTVSAVFGGGLVSACRLRDWRRGGGPR